MTNCRRSATSPASATPSTRMTPAETQTAWLLPPGLSQSLTSTRSTWGTARATTLAVKAHSRPMTSRGIIGLTCG